MTQSLKLGIPDDEAATAPSQKYKLGERKSVWLARLLVPMSIGAWAFFANKLVSAELKPARTEPVPPKPVVDDEAPADPPGASVAKSVDIDTGGKPEMANVVSFSDHPVTAASRNAKSILELGDALDLERDVAGLRGSRSSELRVDTKVQGDDFDFSEPVPGPKGSAPRTPGGPLESARREVAAPQSVGTLRANETIVLTTAILLSHASDLNAGAVAVLDVDSEDGTITSIGEDMWLFVPHEGFEGDASIVFAVTDGQSILQRSMAVSFEDTVTDIVGSGDGDHLVTSIAEDEVVALGGDDTVYTRDGDDIVLGHAGDDVLIGGAGNDTLYGGDGDDHLFGREGDDVLLGGDGDDRIFGGTGDDIALGDEGDDLLSGDQGNDRLLGGVGNDTLHGGDGADFMDGGEGNDEFHVVGTELAGDHIQGGDGSDTLVFKSTRDGATIDLLRGTLSLDGATAGIADVENIFADLGDDVLIASESSNIFAGGDGEDRFVFETVATLQNHGHARDLILDFRVGDRIDLSMLNIELGTLSGITLYFAGQGRSSDLGALSYHFENRDDGDERTVVSARYRSRERDDEDEDSEYLAFELFGRTDLDSADLILTPEDMLT